MRALRRGLATCVALVLAYLIAAVLGGLVPGATRAVPQIDAEAESIYLLRGPIHYDFVFPITPEVRRRFSWLAVDMNHPGAAHLLVGWGGRDFYTTTGTYKDVSLRAVWRGATGDSAVLRVALAGLKEDDWPLHEIPVSRGQYLALLDEIEASFAEQEALNLPGFSPFDAFYPAKGRFHLFNTCNAWLGARLRAAGVRFGAWTPTPYAVTLSARHISR